MHSDEQRKGVVVFSGLGATEVACTPSSFVWIFRGGVVLGVEQDMWRMVSRYYMWHPEFDIVDPGAMIPEYHVEWDDCTKEASFMRVLA